MMNMGGFGLFGGFGMLIFWIAVIALVVWIIRWLAGSDETAGDEGGQALAILKQRYARGEIEREEYEEKRRLLSR
ncbi:MAG: hypothetical protein Kow006_10770 [Gammaproteobacteria bacterium]